MQKITVIIILVLLSIITGAGFAMPLDTSHGAALTLEQRMACQKTIEQVYWQYRIWPSDNKQSKPAFETVMPDSVIRNKVEDILLKSNALEFYWHSPITPEQLQAEMNRIAKNTRNPSQLKHLWKSLNNEPHRIAECIARPILVERLITQWYAWDNRFHDESSFYAMPVPNKQTENHKIDAMTWQKTPFEQWWNSVKTNFSPAISEQVFSYVVPEITVFACADNTWAPTIAPPEKRDQHTAVWTGTEMIIFGGEVEYVYLNDGAKYNPTIDTWTTISKTNAPSIRAGHSSVWTGSEMIIWGGYYWDDAYEDYVYLNDGGRYNPVTNTWTPTSMTNAPDEQAFHTAVWSGTEMIIWGRKWNHAGRYKPATDTWLDISVTNAPVSNGLHTAVWTGSEMIVWGGTSASGGGARYKPSTDSWTPISTTNEPSPRWYHTAVWTGSVMIIWGGHYENGNEYFYHDGGRYDPVTNHWTPVSLSSAPTERSNHSALWTGSRMIIWGGIGPDYKRTGAKYNPVNDIWVPIDLSSAPERRCGHTAVWTGNEMIIWGGSGEYGDSLNTGGRYQFASNTWLPTSTYNVPEARTDHTAVWTGNEMIIWGGDGNSGILNSGRKYYPVLDAWISTATSNAPPSTMYHTAVWTGTDMIVWGGLSNSYGPRNLTNTGAKYNPGLDIWSPTSTVNVPVPRYYHTAVWTEHEMIIWGGDGTLDGYLPLNTGGRYNPLTNTWRPVTTNMAPFERMDHSAVWIGTEMIVWGGRYASYENTGGRYNPVTDSWIATAAPDTLPRRASHSAIWTGTEMIVWGGSSEVYPSSGNRYNPSTDTWSDVSTLNSPICDTPVVWTGTEMIAWCGSSSTYYPDGRYNPATDTWTPMSQVNAPRQRAGYTAVWTGTQMIIWGGEFYSDLFDSGGLYCAATQGNPHLINQTPFMNDSIDGNGNGIIEMDEPVELIGAITNDGSSQATMVSGTLITSDPIIIANTDSLYPDIMPGYTLQCSNCYAITAPSANRPALHWDFTVTESATCQNCAPASHAFTYHVGNSFSDVPPTQLFYPYIEKLFHAGIASGCTASNYCPTGLVAREQMAKFVCNSMNAVMSGSCEPSGCTGIFDDVSSSNPFCQHIEALYNAGIVAGCQASPLLYCPSIATKRETMAKFICTAMQSVDPASCIPFACSGIFNDVNLSNPFCFYIEALFNAGVISGCAPNYFCPFNSITRDQMAKFLVNAFGF